jgi:hypothetical protein
MQNAIRSIQPPAERGVVSYLPSAVRSIFARRRIPDDAWAFWWNVGRLRSADHRLRATSEYVHPNSHELGAIGEFFFGWMVGMRAAADVNPVAGDDGFDFPNVDVKASENIDQPWLKARIEKVAAAPAGFAFALVGIDVDTKTARYCGYATRERLQEFKPDQIPLRQSRATSVTGLRRSASHGPSSHIIRTPALLTRSLPPGFEPDPGFLRAGGF